MLANAFLSRKAKENVQFLKRAYQFWERNSLSIELRTRSVFEQKILYIHFNPVKAGLCVFSEDYHDSSARFYQTDVDDFGFPTKSGT